MLVCVFSLVLLCRANIVFALNDLVPPAEDVELQLKKLRDDMKILNDSYHEVLLGVNRQRNEIRKHETEIQELKATVTKLEEQLNALQEDQIEHNESESYASSPITARSCEQLNLSDQSLKSGMYWIDPDGHGTGDAPILVFCNMTSGSTSIPHDSESSTDVGQCFDAGCYSQSVKYNATMRQLIALTELSSLCTQSITYECKMAPIEFNGVPQSWWTDRNGVRRYDFTGGNSSISKCQCALNGTCLDSKLQCNCNALSPVEISDDGRITDKSALPVTRLNFGRILTQPAFGRYTLSRLECFGHQLISDPLQPPTSCQDLWRLGHVISGFYPVQQAEDIEIVFCDMSQVPAQGKTVPAFVSPKQYNSIVHQLEVTGDNLEKQLNEGTGLKSSIDELKLIMLRQNETLFSQRRKFDWMDGKLTKDLKDLLTNQQKQSADIVELRRKSDRPRGTSINRMPETCADLYTIGHTLSGIYPIRGVNQIEMVYCEMASAVPRQTWIGRADVKSSPVHFYVQRKSPFYLEGKASFSSILPFEITRSNRGSGMDAKKGVFTAPKPGTYVFTFGAIKRDKAQHVDIFLRLNDADRVTSVYGSEHKGYFTLSLQCILTLKTNDKIYLVIQSASGGGIYDDEDKTTYFSGFLLDELLF